MIEILNLSKKFKNNIILENINLKLKKGTTYGFIGTNGSGKTLLFKMILGFVQPTTGEVFINNKKIGKDIDFPSKCGLIIENPGFIENISGYENLKVLAHINNNINDNEIKKYMDFFGLDPNDKKKVKKYSLGMKQKLGLIQAFMENPDILILDEPMNALDEKTVEKVRNLLLEIKHNKIILLASHIKEDIAILCDEIYKIEDKNIKCVI